MSGQLVQVQQRVKQIEDLAEEVAILAGEAFAGKSIQPQLGVKGQQWYRAAREILSKNEFSGLDELINCYDGNIKIHGKKAVAHTSLQWMFEVADRDPGLSDSSRQQLFWRFFNKSRTLVLALEQELYSRELPIRTQLSFAAAADEFETAQRLFDQSDGDEALLRASGVIARIALERHLFTVAEVRGISVTVNPPSKKNPDEEDLLTALVRSNVITAVKKIHVASHWCPVTSRADSAG